MSKKLHDYVVNIILDPQRLQVKADKAGTAKDKAAYRLFKQIMGSPADTFEQRLRRFKKLTNKKKSNATRMRYDKLPR